MQRLKSIFGVIGALVGVLYCGGLIYYYYFLDISGSVQEAKEIGLGPTLLGLGIVGLLLCIPLVWKIVRLFAAPRSPGSGGRSGPDALPPGGDDAFDADAAIARYLARRSAEAAVGSPTARPTHEVGGPAKRPSFGRRTS